MSITAMAYVWQHSTLRGTELVLLLAIADFANEHGIAWPGVETLAGRIRADVRTTQRCISKVEGSQELRIQRGRGPKGTHLYQVVMQANLPLFAEQQEHAGGVAERPPGKMPPRRLATKRGGKAMPPEPSGTVIEKRSGQGKPSPVAALFKAYQDGIAKAYGAEEPPSAKTNGQLAAIVRQLGAEPAMQVVRHYLASRKPYYVTRKHAMDVLAKDARDIWIEIQQAAGGAGAPRVTTAQVYLEYVDAERSRMAEYPAGDALEIAKTFAREYASKVNRETVSCVTIRQGAAERRFKREELR